MARRSVPQRVRRLGVAGLAVVLVLGGAQAAGAHRTELAVEIVSDQGTISPDGSSITFNLATTCDMKWTIVTAQVSVVQAQASGEASFTPRCARLSYGLSVTVPALDGTFQTGDTQVSALLVVQQGKTKEASDSAPLRARPSVSAELADEAILDDGGGAVLIDITVTCPRTSAGRGGEIRIYDGQVVGTGSFGPTACDALPHTTSVRVETSEGTFRVGSAEAFAVASIEEGGDIISGGDLRTIQIVNS